MELAGYGELVPEGIRMLGAQGAFVEIGNIVPGRPTTFEPRLLGGEKRMMFSSMYRRRRCRACWTSSSPIARRLPIKKVISHKFKLAEIDKAFASSEWDGKTIPVVRSAIVP